MELTEGPTGGFASGPEEGSSAKATPASARMVEARAGLAPHTSQEWRSARLSKVQALQDHLGGEEDETAAADGEEGERQT